MAWHVPPKKQLAEELEGKGVVKALVPSGGRGKAGGVKVCSSTEAARDAARWLLGCDLLGHHVSRVLVENEVYYQPAKANQLRRNHVPGGDAMTDLFSKVLIATRSFGSTSQRPWEVLAEAGFEAVQADMSQKMTEDRLIDLLQGVQAAIIGIVPMSARVIEHAPGLRVVVAHGVGVDHIDLEAALRHDVIVANCPGANDQAVADLTIGLMLSIARRIPFVDRDVRIGEWGRHTGSELWKKTLGLIGLGRIGQGVAKRASGFDMEVLAYDPYVDGQQARALGVRMAEFEDVLTSADFLSLHAVLTEETRDMLGPTQLSMMKPSAFLINTARGGLVDETALHAALVEGRLAGAALDAFVAEPPVGSPLLELENVVVTPHIGAHTQEAIERVGVLAARNVVQALRTGEPIHRVT